VPGERFLLMSIESDHLGAAELSKVPTTRTIDAKPPAPDHALDCDTRTKLLPDGLFNVPKDRPAAVARVNALDVCSTVRVAADHYFSKSPSAKFRFMTRSLQRVASA
jgi:hypothetical protein